MKQNFIYKLITFVENEVCDNILHTIEESHWTIEDYRQVASGMSSTNSIPIFHTPLCIDETFEAFKTVKKNKLYYNYINSIKPVLTTLKNFYEFNFYTAFLSRLNPESKINIHRDTGVFLESCHRIHLPLQTNKEIYYRINKTHFNWLKGCLYEFDNTLIHGVINNSKEYRIHLVINLYNLPNDQLIQLNRDDFLNEISNNSK